MLKCPSHGSAGNLIQLEVEVRIGIQKASSDTHDIEHLLWLVTEETKKTEKYFYSWQSYDTVTQWNLIIDISIKSWTLKLFEIKMIIESLSRFKSLRLRESKFEIIPILWYCLVSNEI